MYNSIIEFIEKDTTKIEKFIKESLLSGNMMRFEEELLDTVLEFGRSLYQESSKVLSRQSGTANSVNRAIM